jgi:hypothetical protein
MGRAIIGLFRRKYLLKKCRSQEGCALFWTNLAYLEAMEDN